MLQWHSNISKLMLGRGLLWNTGINGWSSSLGGIHASQSITVFSGSQPTGASVVANWASTYANNYLAHFNGTSFVQQPDGNSLQLTVFPSSTPINSGTAAWAIIWDTAVNDTAVQGASLPSTNFLIVPVSNQTSNGIIRFQNTALVAGTPVIIADGSLTSALS